MNLPERILILVLALLFACREKDTTTNDERLNSFELEAGFKIELIAAEPLISDPVDMEIDEYGRLFVVEMHGYPLDKSGTGKIKLLIDTDKDGVFDQSVVFVDSLILPNSIMRWKNGFIVTDAPNVLYFEDTNGDNRADKTDTLLTGFALSNPQHNLNSPLLGIDNWIYLAHEGAVGTRTYDKEFGDRGGEVYEPGYFKGLRLAVNAGGRSVRFQPSLHTLEVTSSHSQFGQTFDKWGHHLQVGNANHIYQEVLAQRYLERNPGLLVSDATQSLSDHGEAAEVFPITKNPQHQLLTDIGVITSACGIHAYQGGLFPAPFDEAVFVCEPVSNLVHVDKMVDNKSTFTASRIQPHREFLASEDGKFRPVNIYAGPDGALYVVDYYRQIIEHPEWMGDDVVKSGALYNDSDKGRIYRITPTNSPAADWIKGLDLGNLPDDSLVAKLSSPNGWWRQQAQRLLIDRSSNRSRIPVVQMANSSSITGRLHALWVLHSLTWLTPEQLSKALKDSVPGIRENAIRIAESYLENNEVLTELLALGEDPDRKVRFQLLCTLGFVESAEADQVRQTLIFADIEDPWVQIASLTAPQKKLSDLLSTVLNTFKTDVTAYSSLAKRITTMVGSSGHENEIHQLLATTFRSTGAPWSVNILDGLAGGLEDRKNNFTLSFSEENNLVNILFSDSSADLSKAALHVLNVTGMHNMDAVKRAAQEALHIASDDHATDVKRAIAIDFLGIRGSSAYRDLWFKLISPEEPLPVQLAALRSFSNIPDTSVCEYLVRKWSVLTPEVRDAGINAFLKDDSRITILLRAIETKVIPAADVSWPRKVGLMAQWNIPLRDKARALFASPGEKIDDSYNQVLEQAGSEDKGKLVFQQHCAICHQIRGAMGMKVGPDLGTIHNWSKQAILANIIRPSQSISSGYELWSVELKNGEILQGIIESETPGVITLINTNGWKKSVKRSDIKTLSALNLSAMPDDLVKRIRQDEMANLLAFLKANK